MNDEPDLAPEPRSLRPAVAALVAGGALFAALALLLHSQQSALLSTTSVASQLDDQGKLRRLAEVIETTRALKLVTVTVDSRVRTHVRDEQWRGTASAVVEAPVRYVYGVDLSELSPDAF